VASALFQTFRRPDRKRANMRKLHKPIRALIFDCEVLSPKEFGFRDDIVTTMVTTVARENSFAVSR
jgi:hypothetical protein